MTCWRVLRMQKQPFGNMKNNFLLILMISMVWAGCQGQDPTLPYLGRHSSGNGDTNYYAIPDFELFNQEGKKITRQQLEGKIYVADFFFISCPTICPKMKQQLLRVYGEFSEEEDVLLVSHTIDPKRDSVGALRAYADKLDVEAGRWHFLTGDFDDIYEVAGNYMLAAQEDENEPGGFLHSGSFALIDRNGHVRGYYDGTDREAVDQLMKDMKVLLDE